MIVALLGPPGAGKTTLCGELARHGYRGIHVRGSRLGYDAARSGDLLEDSLAIADVVQQLEEAVEGKRIALDGFPRTTSQAQALETWSTRNRAIVVPVFLDPSEPELRLRLARRSKEASRTDDVADILAKRSGVFAENTIPTVSHYGDMGRLIRFADEPIPFIASTIAGKAADMDQTVDPTGPISSRDHPA